MRKALLITLPAALLSFFLLTPHDASADPSISGVSGTVAHGLPVTISGSGFGTKTPAKPLMWANFEDGKIAAAPGLSTGTLESSNANITSAGQDRNSTFSARGQPLHDGAKENVRLYVEGSSGGHRDFYMFVRRKYDHPDWWTNSGVNNYKFHRTWPRSNFGGTPNLIVAVANTPNRLRYNVEGVGLLTDANVDDAKPPVQTWLREEYQVRHSDVDVANGTLKFSYNGRLAIDRDSVYKTRDGDSQELWLTFNIENFWSDNPPPNNAYVYLDDFYVDTTWARVMIGDQPTFEGSMHREIQLPTAWSPNSITINVNQGSFQSLKDKYLYVIDAQGNVNSSGFAISTDPPPASPQNVRIISQ